MLAAVDQLTKGTMAVMHQVALLWSEVSSLRKANEVLSKRWRAKRTRVQLGGSLTVQDAQDLLDQKAWVGRQCKIRSQVVVVQGKARRKSNIFT
jgi:hypothetical protein